MLIVLRKWVYVVILIMSTVLSYAQAPRLNFKTIDNTSGLPNNFINAIEMDSLGFLWVGTTDGLCRYDSPNQVQTYKSGQLGLESSHIKDIKAGENNKLWIGTNFGGVTVYDYEKDTYKTYNNAEEDKFKLSNTEILSIHEIDSTEIWIGTENGLNVLYPENDSIYHFPISSKDDSKINSNAILDIYEDNNGWIWIGTWGGSFYLYLPSESGKHNDGKFRKIDIGKESGALSIWKVYQDSKGIYWIATHNRGLYAMLLPSSASNDINNQNWQPVFHSYTEDLISQKTISSNYITDLQEDDEGNNWITTTHGLNVIRRSERDKFSHENPTQRVELLFERHYENSFKNTIANNLVRNAFKDKQGIMWFGTISGLNQFNWYTNQFNIVTIPSSNNINSPTNDQLINSIFLKDENTLLIASHLDGLLTYDLKKEELVKQKEYKNLKFSQRISTINQFDNKLYIGTTSGVSIYDTITQNLVDYNLQANSEKEESELFITYILKDSNKRLWVGSEEGLILVNEEKNEFKWYTNSQDDPTSISDNAITKIYEDSHGNIWFTTYNGLNLLQENNGSFSFRTYKRGNTDFDIPFNKLTAIDEYNGNIYIGGRNGIFKFDLKTKKFETLEYDRLQYSINSILITKEGVLWASNSDGVLRYNLNSTEYKLFNKTDGIRDMSFRVAAGHIGDKGDIFFGGIKGFIQFNDAELKKNDAKPEVYITQIKTINTDREHAICGINRKTITLPSNNYYLALNFTGLNYNQPENNQYKYKLEGFSDEDWQTTQTQQAIYTNLDAGEYTFKVIASNNEGVWNNEGAELNIIVKAAMVETLWFKLLLFLLMLSFAWLAFQLYTKNIRNRNEILREYNEKLNTQVQKTEAANTSLEEREKYMKVLLTKLEQSNEELLRSNKDLEEFAYAASHDMKEPLRTVGTFTNLLNKKYHDKIGESGKEYIEFITQGVDRMSALINSLLSYSQVGKKDIEFEECDLNIIVDSKIKDLSQIISEKNVSIQCDILPTIICAGNQIGMVFYNLILNGIKFNKSEHPRIEISSFDNESEWQFNVSDNGIGIPAKYEKQIFEIFKRLHNRDEYEGTGIGLALCNKIILRHDGQISVQSEPNEGTTFSFTISKNIKLVKTEPPGAVSKKKQHKKKLTKRRQQLVVEE